MNLTIIYHCGARADAKAFYRRLSLEGIRVTVIAPKKIILSPTDMPEQGDAVPQDSPYRLIPVDLINPRRYNLGFRPGQFTKALKQSDPDIVHIFNEYHCFPVAQTILALRLLFKKRIPLVIYGFQNIDYSKIRPRGIAGAIVLLLRRCLIKFNMKHVDGATTASTKAMNILKRHKDALRVQRIFWGVDLEAFGKRDKGQCRQQLGLPQDKVILGYFGRMVKEKGLEDVPEVLRRLDQAYFLLVGDGPYVPEILRVASKLAISDRVIFRSSVAKDELNLYYNSLDCFILASRTTDWWQEQYGRVLVEAMTCGIPIAASSGGAIPEVLDGYPGHCLFKEGDRDQLISCVQRLIRQPCASAAREYLYRFTIENFSIEHARFYRSIFGDR